MPSLKTVAALSGGLLFTLPAAADAIDQAQQRAVKALEQLARTGSTRAAYELGRRYETGVGVDSDPGKAFALYCAAASDGHAAAAYYLAVLYRDGQGTAASPADAAAWGTRALKAGYPAAGDLLQGLGRVRPAADPDCRPPSVRPMTPPRAIARLVERLAPGFGLDPKLVLAVIQAESGFRTDAVSPRNARGLMQLLPETAERFGVRDVFDPQDNIRGGMRYLQWLLAYFQGQVPLVLAAYNAGEGAVDRHGGVPPYAETRDYVARIRAIYPRDRHPFKAKLVRRASDTAVASADADAALVALD